MVLLTPTWQPAPATLTLPPHTVHIWRVQLQAAAEQLQAQRGVLSPDEQARANRYHFERDRRRFIRARFTLRKLLGRYLGIAPHQVRFLYSERGKPALAPDLDPSLCFNVSHSQDLAVYGFAWGQALGIDVEYLRPMRDVEQLSQRFFSASEHALIRSCPPQERLEIFFRLWTAKEACLKALGDGLAGLEETEVTLTEAGVDLVRLRAEAILSHSCPWSLRQWIPDLGYIAALAVQQPVYQYHYWDVIEDAKMI